MEVQTVLFDFGHTLFDVREPGELIGTTAAARGLSVDDADALRIWQSIAQAAMTPEEMARQRDISRDAHRSNWVRLLAPLEELFDEGPSLPHPSSGRLREGYRHPAHRRRLDGLQREIVAR